MGTRSRRHGLTIGASGLLSISMLIMALGMTGIVPTGTVWRALIIPAYLPMLASAIMATSLSLPNTPLLWVISIAAMILPFAVLDWLRARFANSRTSAA